MSYTKKLRIGQWTVEVTSESKEIFDEIGIITRYRIFNDQFLEGVDEAFVTVENGGYGQPLSTIEKSLAFPLPMNMSYVDVDGNDMAEAIGVQRIGGILTVDHFRASISNARKKDIEVIANGDGSFQVDGKQYWLVGLFWKDRNRTFNFDAFFALNPPKNMTVRVRELADIGPLFFE